MRISHLGTRATNASRHRTFMNGMQIPILAIKLSYLQNKEKSQTINIRITIAVNEKKILGKKKIASLQVQGDVFEHFFLVCTKFDASLEGYDIPCLSSCLFFAPQTLIGGGQIVLIQFLRLISRGRKYNFLSMYRNLN